MLRHPAAATLFMLGLHAMGCDGASRTTALPASPKDSSADDVPDAAPSSPSRDGGNQDAGARDGGANRSVSLTWRVAAGKAIALPDDSDGGAEAVSEADLPGLADVAVCLYGASNESCTTSDAEGWFVLEGLPESSELIVTLDKDGYTPLALPIYTTSTNLDANAFATRPIAMRPPALESELPVSIDMADKGAFVFVAVTLGANGQSAGAPGVIVTTVPSAGDDQFFVDETETYDLSAKSIVHQAGVYFNVEPGEYEITFSSTDFECSPLSLIFGGYGYPASASSVRVPVLAGHTTVLAAALCSPS